eukprot:4231200-Karenia_brevis.AAC.1
MYRSPWHQYIVCLALRGQTVTSSSLEEEPSSWHWKMLSFGPMPHGGDGFESQAAHNRPDAGTTWCWGRQH